MGAIGIITALAAAATGIYAALDSSKQNKVNRYTTGAIALKNKADSEHAYKTQRADALADWNAQNQYNHPSQQMERLRQAGLNPHLVYGKGADATADSIRSSSVPVPDNKYMPATPINLQGIQNALTMFYDLNLRQAQTDNVNQSTALMQQDAVLKQASTAKTMQETAKSKFDLDQAKELKDHVIEQAKLQNKKLQADTIYTTDENQRKALTNTADLKMTAEKILTERLGRAKTEDERKLIQENIQALRQTEDIKQYHQKLTEMGIAPNDPWYFRALMNLVHENLEMPPFMKGIIESIQNPMGGTGKGGTFNNHRSFKKGAGGTW